MKKRRVNKKKIVILITIIIALIIVIAKLNTKNKNSNDLVLDAKEQETQNDDTIVNEILPEKYYDVKVPILCYHGVLNEAWGIKELFVKVDEFEAQMKYLSEQGYTSLFVSEIESANKYEKPIIITFDDGYKDVYNNAFPILKKYNIKANVYVITDWIDGEYYVSTNMIQEMKKSSLIEIGSHTLKHRPLATLSENDIESELSESKKVLEQIIGSSVDVIAYPNGSYDNKVINIAKKYYKYALSIVNGKEDPKNLNTYDLRRIYVYRRNSIEEFKKLF